MWTPTSLSTEACRATMANMFSSSMSSCFSSMAHSSHRFHRFSTLEKGVSQSPPKRNVTLNLTSDQYRRIVRVIEPSKNFLERIIVFAKMVSDLANTE